MVRLFTASNPMEARIIAARLGSEGIVWQLQGSVDGPYPLGPVEVLVSADGYEAARDLLLSDEVESSFDAGADLESSTNGPSWREVAWLAAVMAVVVMFALARMVGQA